MKTYQFLTLAVARVGKQGGATAIVKMHIGKARQAFTPLKSEIIEKRKLYIFFVFHHVGKKKNRIKNSAIIQEKNILFN